MNSDYNRGSDHDQRFGKKARKDEKRKPGRAGHREAKIRVASDSVLFMGKRMSRGAMCARLNMFGGLRECGEQPLTVKVYVRPSWLDEADTAAESAPSPKRPVYVPQHRLMATEPKVSRQRLTGKKAAKELAKRVRI